MRGIDPESVLTSHQVGQLLNVSRRSVNNWIEQGHIEAFRTPGGHRRVRAADLIAFLNANDMPIPSDLALGTRRRIVIVDDDERQLRSYQRLLAPLDEHVEIKLFSRGIDALLEIGAFLPDTVVLDILMPGLDGLEVCRRIKAGERTKHIDVVMCSGKLSGGVDIAAREAGARCCLDKPVDSARLLSELRLPAVP
ncbi:MAG TPA: response regulator [Polyangiaceae bacterium]|nr:response regulator [Polyangiaceae bacterium]